MHEYGLTQNILSIALEYASKNGASQIKTIRVKAGQMMAIVEESMQFHFEYLKKGTIAENAELIIETVPIKVKCPKCGKTSVVDEFSFFTCPNCGQLGVELISGKEFYVESLDVA